MRPFIIVTRTGSRACYKRRSRIPTQKGTVPCPSFNDIEKALEFVRRFEEWWNGEWIIRNTNVETGGLKSPCCFLLNSGCPFSTTGDRRGE